MRFRPVCGRCGDVNAVSATRCDGCGAPLYPRSEYKAREAAKVHEPYPLREGKRKQLLNAERRKEYGCITTWEHPDGRTISFHRVGPLREAVRSAADTALELCPDLRLVSYSTPDTIFADMIGARVDAEHGPRGFKATTGKSVPKPIPEVTMLALAGLPKDLLHPRLRRSVKENRRK